LASVRLEPGHFHTEKSRPRRTSLTVILLPRPLRRDVFPVLDAILKRELVQRHLQDYSVNSGVLAARDPPRSRIGTGQFSVLRFGNKLDRKYGAFHRERKLSRLDSPRDGSQ
jgi:hypothetical protein